MLTNLADLLEYLFSSGRNILLFFSLRLDGDRITFVASVTS